MADRFDALTVREYQDRQSGETKSRWVKIGVGFVSEKDGSIKVMLDATPLDGVVHLRRPRADGEGGQRGGGRGQGQRRQGQDEDFDGQF